MRELQKQKAWQKENLPGITLPDENPEALIYSIIDEAIDHLPARQKEVFLLHRYQRLTYLSIAEKLGIGKESVKTHMGLAIKSITRYLRRVMALTLIFFALAEKIF
jgi:RNA polymerase sigma-70 factor (ECF subfamily)